MVEQDLRKNRNGGQLGFEAELFKAADKLRGNMEPSDYKHVALGLIFLKYISDAFEARHAELLVEDPQAAEDKDEARPQGELLVYQGQGLEDPIQVRLEGETVWLSQKLLAELYGVAVPTINEHISNISRNRQAACRCRPARHGPDQLEGFARAQNRRRHRQELPEPRRNRHSQPHHRDVS